MLDIKKALAYLRGELARVNRIIEVYEAIAEDNYEKRRRRAVAKARHSDKQHGAPFSPPEKLDPDATLWLH